MAGYSPSNTSPASSNMTTTREESSKPSVCGTHVTGQFASNTLPAISLDIETMEKEAEVGTLEHAVAQGAPAPITLDKSSSLTISLEEGDVDEQSVAPKSDDTINAYTTPTSYMASDARTTSKEAEGGIVERVVVAPGRTILAGRNEMSLRQREKQPAGHGGEAIDIEQSDPSETRDLDTDTLADIENTAAKSFGSRIPGTDKCKAPGFQQTNTLKIMAESDQGASLHGGALERDSHPASKPSKAPWHGAQTSTAQQYLQTTSQTELSGDSARRAHLNMANELARTLAQAEPVLLGEFDFAVVDGPSSLPNRRPSVNPSFTASANARLPHTALSGVYIHTAKCDICNRRNKSVLQRCDSCTKQMCRECMTKDPIHSTASIDWTNHGAQSASKPRTNPGPTNQAPTKLQPKQRLAVKEKRSEEQMGLFVESGVRSRVQSFSNSRNTTEGRAAIAERAGHLAEGTDGADDEDDVMYLGERPSSSMGGGIRSGQTEIQRKITREAAAFDRTPPRDGNPPRQFRPLGASVPYRGPSDFQAPQQPQQPQHEVYYSVYDRNNKAKEVQTEKKRVAKSTRDLFTVELSNESAPSKRTKTSFSPRTTPK